MVSVRCLKLKGKSTVALVSSHRPPIPRKERFINLECLMIFEVTRADSRHFTYYPASISSKFAE